MREGLTLRTGELAIDLIDGQLTNIRVAGVRALDRIYPTVRGPQWQTVEGETSEPTVELGLDTFEAVIKSNFQSAETDIAWTVSIAGTDGTITIDLQAEVQRECELNRLGVCLLHPLELIGHRVFGRSGTTETQTTFPGRVAAGKVLDALTGMRSETDEGIWLNVEFKGAVYETEDHRNWTDAGWKTYCPPLGVAALLRSYRVGDRFQTTIVLSTIGQPDRCRSAIVGADHDKVLVADISDDVVGMLPAVGVASAAPLSKSELDLLRLAGLSHLFVEWDVRHDATDLHRAAQQTAELGLSLDVAVIAPAGADWALVADVLAEHRNVMGRVSVFEPVTLSTALECAHGLRTALGDRGLHVAIGGGSLTSFAEVNRSAPDAPALDFITFGVTPQMHHSDAELVMDTLRAQPHTLREAQAKAGSRPISVGPITFRRREDQTEDLRHQGDFLGAWLVGSIAALADADSVTYFATSGRRGILSADDGADPSPAWQVLAWIAGLRGEPVFKVSLPEREIAVLAMRTIVLVANLRGIERAVQLGRGGRTENLRLAPYGIAFVSGGPLTVDADRT